MAKLTIQAVEHEAGWMEGVMGQGIPVMSAVDLVRGDIVTAKGVKASAGSAATLPIGFVGFDTADYGKVMDKSPFRPVRQATVYMDTLKAAGTPIYLSDTAGELSDAAGTVKVIVGYYFNDTGESTTNAAYLDIRPMVNA